MDEFDNITAGGIRRAEDEEEKLDSRIIKVVPNFMLEGVKESEKALDSDVLGV